MRKAITMIVVLGLAVHIITQAKRLKTLAGHQLPHTTRSSNLQAVEQKSGNCG